MISKNKIIFPLIFLILIFQVLITPHSIFAKSSVPTYDFIDLGILPSNINESQAEAINDKQNITGDSPTFLGDSVFFWSKDFINEANVQSDEHRSYSYDINNLNQIVGVLGSSRTYGFIWMPDKKVIGGDVQTLTPLNGYPNSAAHGINESGEVVGSSSEQPQWLDSAPVTNHQHATLWEQGQPSDVGVLPGDNASIAIAINNGDQIIGQSSYCTSPLEQDCSSVRAFLWDKGTMQSIGFLNQNIPYSIAKDINDNGQIVGISKIIQSEPRAFFWQNGTMMDIGAFSEGNSFSYANAINNSGEVVGWSDAGPTLGMRAFIWDKSNGLKDLNDLVNTGGETLVEAHDINDKGDITGNAIDSNGFTHGFLMIKK